MICKECVREKVCKNAYLFKVTPPNVCGFFQNKADFVEVCRCKDCKHQEQCCEFIMISGRDKPLNYCSYGERKENE